MENRLALLENDLDQVFGNFYEHLLSDKHFASFFGTDEDVRSLITRQKDNFKQALHEGTEQLNHRFVALGIMHHKIAVPYPDFMVGIDYLAEQFYEILSQDEKTCTLSHQAFLFFKHIKDFVAKGYLIAALEEDKNDIETFIRSIHETRDSSARVVEEQFVWLRSVLKAIAKEDEELLPNLDMESSTLYRWLLSDESESYIPNQEDRVHLFDINRRICNSAENIFYFIKNDHYNQALSMYTKLSKELLTMNNIITVMITQFKMKELIRDQLTGLLNRKTLNDVLKQEMRLAVLTRKPLAIILIDIDHFKVVNDTYGHMAGDCILQGVSEIMAEQIRATDYAFRYGGEEFLIVINNTEEAGARHVAEKIRATIESQEFDCNGHDAIKVTSSFGIAVMSVEENSNIEQLIEVADKKLYEAKAQGRNRVCS
jgi:diguanylate cyclase (GGDEF)-like protein